MGGAETGHSPYQERWGPHLSEVALLAGKSAECVGGHDVHGGAAALVEAAAVLVGGLLVARVRQRAVHSLSARAAAAPSAQAVRYRLPSKTDQNPIQLPLSPVKAAVNGAFCMFIGSAS